MSDQAIALIGMMGAGKSTVGMVLASLINRRFLDSDAEVEHEAGKSVAEIFRDHGEDAFRDWEARVLREAVASSPPPIIGVAGGALLREESASLVREKCTVVWLKAPIDVLVGRVIHRHLDRPLIAENPEQAMKDLYAKREPIYEAMADITISTDGKTPDRIGEEIVEALK